MMVNQPISLRQYMETYQQLKRIKSNENLKPLNENKQKIKKNFEQLQKQITLKFKSVNQVMAKCKDRQIYLQFNKLIFQLNKIIQIVFKKIKYQHFGQSHVNEYGLHDQQNNKITESKGHVGRSVKRKQQKLKKIASETELRKKHYFGNEQQQSPIQKQKFHIEKCQSIVNDEPKVVEQVSRCKLKKTMSLSPRLFMQNKEKQKFLKRSRRLDDKGQQKESNPLELKMPKKEEKSRQNEATCYRMKKSSQQQQSYQIKINPCS